MNNRPPPISAEQIESVQQSWAKVLPIAETAATLFYQRLFELDPTLKPLFRTEARTQRGKLIGMLNLIVKGLRNLDGLVATLQDLGLRHVTYGVQDSHFDTVGEALLWALEKGLGDQFAVEVRAAWVRAYSLVATTMKAAK